MGLKLEEKILSKLGEISNENGEAVVYTRDLSKQLGYTAYNTKVKDTLLILNEKKKISIISREKIGKVIYYTVKLNELQEKIQESKKIIENKVIEKIKNKKETNALHIILQYIKDNADKNGYLYSNKRDVMKALKYAHYIALQKDLDDLIKNNKLTIEKVRINDKLTFKWIILDDNVENLSNGIKEVDTQSVEKSEQAEMDQNNQISNNNENISFDDDIDKLFDDISNVTKNILSKIEKNSSEIQRLKAELEASKLRERKWMTRALQYREMLYSR